jgi:hypothetical protein
MQKRLDQDYTLNISMEHNKLTVIAAAKNKSKALKISFRLLVPQHVSTELSTDVGNINLSNLSGAQNFSASVGSLRFDKLKGKISGETSVGNINAENSTGDFMLSTSSGLLNLLALEGNVNANIDTGSVNAGKIKGNLIVIATSSHVAIHDLIGSLEISADGGDMEISIKEIRKYVKVKGTGNGDIKLKLPGKKGFNLDLHGKTLKVDVLNNFKGTKNEHTAKGTLHGGGIPVKVEGGGNINLQLR